MGGGESSFTGDPGGCVKEGYGDGSLSLHRVLAGERVSYTGDFERCRKERSKSGASLSEGALRV